MADSPRIFPVAEFGAVGDGRTGDRAAIQAALDAATGFAGEAVVRFEPGRIYRLDPNTRSVAALQLSHADRVALEGNGAMLLFHPSNCALSVFGSSRIRISGFRLDCDPLPYTQGRIVSLGPESLVFAVDAGYPDPFIGDETLYPNHKHSDCVFIDGADRTYLHVWRRICRVEPAGSRRFRVSFHMGRGIHPRMALVKEGDFVAVKLPYGKPPFPRAADGRFLATEAANLLVGFSSGVAVEDVESYAAPVMTLVAHGSEDVRVDGLRIVRKPGTDRLVASCSDGAHMKSLTVMPRFGNCRFEALMDDAINIKVSAQKVLGIEGARVLMRHNDILWNDIVLKPGDVLELVDHAQTRFLGTAAVTGFERQDYQEAWVALDRVPAGLAPGDLAFLRPQTAAVVSNCLFGTQLKTALLTRPPTLVEECRFEDLAHGIHLLFRDGIEGPAPRGIQVRNCSFRNLATSAVAIDANTLGVFPPGLPGVAMEDCRLELGGRAVAVRGRIPDLRLRNLSIETDGTRPMEALFPVETSTQTVENVFFR